MSLNKPEIIIVHHTGGTDSNPLADTSHHTFEMVDKYHRSLGWESCGYHVFIEKNGKTVYNPSRALNYHGGHTSGYNTKSIGICLAGNFDATLPTTEQTSSLKKVLEDLKTKYPNVPVVPHRKFANKTCYGNKLSDDWATELLGKEVKPRSLKDFTRKELLQELLSRE